MSQLKVDTITDEAGTGAPDFPNGISGDGSGLTNLPAQAPSAQLDALAGLATNGIIARTGANTVAARTLTAGTNITITNGDGVSGNPTISATSGAPTTAQVTAAYAGASSRDVGTYTAAWYAVSGGLSGDSQVHIATGTNIAGSSLRVSSRGNETVGPPTLAPFVTLGRQSNISFDTTGTTTLAGTWKLMTSGAYRSRREDGAGGFFSWHPHLWLRIS